MKEMKAFFNRRGRPQDLPKEKIKYIFRLADKDGDKQISFEEFVEIMEHPDFQHLFEHWMNSYVNFLVPRPKPIRKIVPRARSVRITREEKIEETSLMAMPSFKRRVSVESIEVKLYEEEEIAYMDAFTCCPPPFAMVLFTILELVFFLIDEMTQKDSTLTGSGVTAKSLIYEPSKRHEAWRFLTYMFVHIGYLHIVVNLAFQLLLGIPLEMVHKWWRVSLLYFAGVIAGSLATSITDPWVRLAGASGGVYSLITAHIATIVMNWSEMTFPLIQLLIFGLIVCCDLGSSIYERYYLHVNDQVGYAAHFGGAVAGLLVGIYILKNINVKSCEKYIWWAAVVIYVVLMVIAIFINIFLPGRYPPRQT